ncbi:MAG: enoyl-CoA hydratase, partial [Gammaproteobacteria bacterium]|nr:enoyl-CoA hydratase [Gammaproteobacteria bacterium]
MSERTRFQLEDGVAWIGMDDGKVNALSASMIGEIDAALDRAEEAGAVVLLCGRPGIFSAGFDLKTFQ